jgi:feS assembly protein sufD
MDLKDTIINYYKTLPQDALSDIRVEAFARFIEKGFPLAKQEAWKYTSVKELLDYSFEVRTSSSSTSELRPHTSELIPRTSKLVFVNGVLNENLSDYKGAEIEICSLQEAMTSDKYAELLRHYYGKNTDLEEPFSALNTVVSEVGAFVRVKRGKAIEAPVELVYLTDSQPKPFFTHVRNFIYVEEAAEVHIIERHHSFSPETVLTNSVTEVFVEKNALLDYYKLQNDRENALLIDNTYVSQEENSHAAVHTFSFGGKTTRNNLNFFHRGEHIESTLKGLTILKGNQHVDHYTFVEHALPNCESHQDYKSIVDEEAINVFNGKILVEKIAQKTNAYQQNDNIILNPKAAVYTKPQLEIFADDVKCSHGCTVGSLNPDSLFYLQARGIPKKEAAALLTYAFANTVMQTVRIPELASYLNKIIAGKLGVTIDF